MKQRFIIKYCKVIDAVLLLDTLKRMPLTMIIDKICYVHGLICMDMERAKEQQEYYESLFGYQRPNTAGVCALRTRVSATYYSC